MKWLLLVLPTIVFAQESLTGKLALIRARHPALTAAQVANVVQILSAAEVERAYAAPPVVDSGVDLSTAAAAPVDPVATHAAGIVSANRTAYVSGLVVLVRAQHPELSPAQIADIYRILN